MAEKVERGNFWSLNRVSDWVVCVEISIDSENEFDVGCYFIGKSPSPSDQPFDNVVFLLCLGSRHAIGTAFCRVCLQRISEIKSGM